MDHSWMKSNRLSLENDNGVIEFFQFVETNLPVNNEFFYCPCIFFVGIVKKHGKKELLNYVYWDGICQHYTTWAWPDEVTKTPTATYKNEVDIDMVID